MSQTILIIDDFASVRLYHVSFLTRKGYRCLEAGNGVEALAQLAEYPVDLILLDMVMPGMSGGEFLIRLEANEHWSTIPILAVTSEKSIAAVAFRGTRREVEVLAKPVTPGMLLQHVQRLLAATDSLRGANVE